MDIKDLSAQIESLLAGIENAPTPQQVEVGATMWTLAETAKAACDSIKEILREKARKRLGGIPGTTRFNGVKHGTVTITVPHPRLRIKKGKDIEILKRLLGDDFDLYFETVTTYKPRRETGERVVKVASEKQRSALLDSLEEVEGTPRVSFKHK